MPVLSLHQEDPWRSKWQPVHSSTLAWRIPWTEEPGGLRSVVSLGVGHALEQLRPTPAARPHAGASSRPQSILALPVSLSVHALSHCVQPFNASHINNLGGLYMDLTFSIFQV